jgi:hypothetical protein
MSPDDHDTLLPPSAPATTPDLAAIPAGKAHIVVTAGFLEVLGAISRLEAVCAAVARALDATAEGGPTT